MSGRRSDALRTIVSSVHGDDHDVRRNWARYACAARSSAEGAPTDAATDARLDLSFKCLANLAASPSPDMAGLAAKLASLVHLQLLDDARHFDEVTRVGFAITASALADAVLIGDRPIGGPSAPKRDLAGAA